MTTMLDVLQPTILQFPASNCASGKVSARSNRTGSAHAQPKRRGASPQPIPLVWVTLQVYAASSGYSVGALRQKMRRGQFIEGKHFRRAPDGRVLMNVEECQKWGIDK